jgi:hypothetical protein
MAAGPPVLSGADIRELLEDGDIRIRSIAFARTLSKGVATACTDAPKHQMSRCMSFLAYAVT